MASYNKTVIMGNLTRDVETRFTPGGKQVGNVSVAVNEYVKDGDDKVTFFDVVLWEKNAENCAKYLSKGSPIFIEGRMQTEKWADKETGNPRSKMVLVANVVQFLGSGQSEPDKPVNKPSEMPSIENRAARQAAAAAASAADDEGDDIPF